MAFLTTSKWREVSTTEMPKSGTPVSATITRVRLLKLFGLYSYDIPGDEISLNRTPILYGENGLGKTNILKAIFHLLSPAHNQGHRTSLGKIKFQSIEIFLSNGVVVSARRTDSLTGAFRAEVTQTFATDSADQLLGAWDWYPKDDPQREASNKLLSHVDIDAVNRLRLTNSSKQRARAIQTILFEAIEKESNPLQSEEAFLKALRENVPRVYLLTADRILRSDAVAREAFRISTSDPTPRTPEAMLTWGREHALFDAIGRASLALSELGVDATREGSRSVHSIYEELIKRFATRQRYDTSETALSVTTLKERLRKLTSEYELFSKYGLATDLRGEELITLLDDVKSDDRAVAVEVLTPYVDSLLEQAHSLRSAYKLIDTVVSTVNEFLYDKSLTFTVGRGMVVQNKLGESLEASDLSSGEQQLLLLFCHITMAHMHGGIFIIDEPEISLNIKWQRRLVDALSKLDPSQKLQFVLASHSMEILARHDESVVPLSECVIHG